MKFTEAYSREQVGQAGNKYHNVLARLIYDKVKAAEDDGVTFVTTPRLTYSTASRVLLPTTKPATLCLVGVLAYKKELGSCAPECVFQSAGQELGGMDWHKVDIMDDGFANLREKDEWEWKLGKLFRDLVEGMWDLPASKVVYL